jgi:hypothetical protein
MSLVRYPKEPQAVSLVICLSPEREKFLDCEDLFSRRPIAASKPVIYGLPGYS